MVETILLYWKSEDSIRDKVKAAARLCAEGVRWAVEGTRSSNMRGIIE